MAASELSPRLYTPGKGTRLVGTLSWDSGPVRSCLQPAPSTPTAPGSDSCESAGTQPCRALGSGEPRAGVDSDRQLQNGLGRRLGRQVANKAPRGQPDPHLTPRPLRENSTPRAGRALARTVTPPGQ